MNKKLRRALKDSFAAPLPVGKKAFLRGVRELPIGNFEFIRTQIAYIRKWVWALSATIFAFAVIGSEWIGRDMLWCISAFMPLLALGIITECGRAEAYKMAELELSTRFSIKSAVLARLGITGCASLILICAVTPFIAMQRSADIFRTGVYILCPYLLTAYSGFLAVRKIHGKESLYFCAGIAAAVSVLNMILSQELSCLYIAGNFIWWGAALTVLCVGTAIQCYKMIKQTEELTWSL